MKYYLDGYNLLFRRGYKVHDKKEANLQNQREDLISELNHQCARLKIDLTIVFDGSEAFEPFIQTHFEYIEIIYTARGFTADQMIIQFLQEKSYSKKTKVITSDKKLARICNSLGSSSQSIESFIFWINAKWQKLGKKAAYIEEHSHCISQNHYLHSHQISYYEEIFENRYRQAIEAEQINKPKSEGKAYQEKLSPPLKNNIQSNDPSNALSAEEARWLKAFEDRSCL